MTGGKGGRPHGEGPGEEQEKILLRKKVIIQLSAIGPQRVCAKSSSPIFPKLNYTIYYRSAETYTRHL